ncbi:uncharacterized protein LOC123503425 [Portunus trituberculatus]|uniref:uncharacterized protein LOC123503425 n=1 Tax=Portunus trituberculatus TaxID=210409 RepID=UPI001E1CEA9D|nr:uncharacterized protein LOC123503425 [Portunus trituberculatus]
MLQHTVLKLVPSEQKQQAELLGASYQGQEVQVEDLQVHQELQRSRVVDHLVLELKILTLRHRVLALQYENIPLSNILSVVVVPQVHLQVLGAPPLLPLPKPVDVQGAAVHLVHPRSPPAEAAQVLALGLELMDLAQVVALPQVQPASPHSGAALVLVLELEHTGLDQVVTAPPNTHLLVLVLLVPLSTLLLDSLHPELVLAQEHLVLALLVPLDSLHQELVLALEQEVEHLVPALLVLRSILLLHSHHLELEQEVEHLALVPVVPPNTHLLHLRHP